MYPTLSKITQMVALDKTLAEYVLAIRAQLEAQYETEVNRAQQQEIAHRKEIVRILSTHELNGSKTAEMGSGDADALLRGYKEENERLYAKTKGKKRWKIDFSILD